MVTLLIRGFWSRVAGGGAVEAIEQGARGAITGRTAADALDASGLSGTLSLAP